MAENNTKTWKASDLIYYLIGKQKKNGKFEVNAENLIANAAKAAIGVVGGHYFRKCALKRERFISFEKN